MAEMRAELAHELDAARASSAERRRVVRRAWATAAAVHLYTYLNIWAARIFIDTLCP